MKKLSVMIVSSSQEDAALLLEELRAGGREIFHCLVGAADEMKSALAAASWDAALVDFRCGNPTLEEADAILRENGRSIPLVAFGRDVEPEETIAAMKAGIADFVVMSNISRLVPAVEQVVERASQGRVFKTPDEPGAPDALQWRVIFDSIFDMICVTDAELQVLAINKAMADFLGIAPEEATGRPCYEIFHRQAARLPDCPYPELLLSGAPVSREIFDPFWRRHFFISLSPIFNADGANAGAVHIVRDITDRKETEKELKQTEELYRTVSLYSHSGLAIVQEGRIVYVNPYIARDFGYSEEELLGRTMRDFMHPDDFEETRRNAIRMLKGESQTPYAYRIVPKDGSIRWVVETVSSIEHNGRRAVLGNLMDVTERILMEKELADARETILRSEKLTAIGTLAGGISHEILNPLNIISLTIQMMGLQEWPPEKTHEMLATCEKQIGRIEKIARDISTFAKTSKTDVVPVNVNGLIESVLALLLPKLRISRIDLVRNFQPDIPLISLDENNIWQVFLNLINNAIDAMETAEEKTLEIATALIPSPHGEVVQIAFNDRGPGIEEKTLLRIFDPFFTTKEPGKGTGLGLSISRNIVNEHGGTLRAEKSRWGGASFIVELPLTKNEA